MPLYILYLVHFFACFAVNSATEREPSMQGDDIDTHRTSIRSLDEAKIKMATVSAILMELSESYHQIAGSCCGGLFKLGELDLVVQVFCFDPARCQRTEFAVGRSTVHS
jgi:hypothetical protein